jgi:sugar lactone lactonase YvrE
MTPMKLKLLLPTLLAVSLALSAADSAAQYSTITTETSGSILLVDAFFDTYVIRMDPLTGATSIVSGNMVGSGPPLAQPWDIAREASGSLLVNVITSGQLSLLRVDATTGDRSTLSDATTGAGPDFQAPRAVAVDADGNIFVADNDADPFGRGTGRILRVDPFSGDRTVVSDASVGTGPTLGFLESLAAEQDGTLVVVDSRRGDLKRIDPVTGRRSMVSGRRRGRGPRLAAPRGVTVEADGTLVVSNTRSFFCIPLCSICGGICRVTGPSVMRVDPVSGDRTLVTGAGHCLDPLNLGCSADYKGVVGEGPNLSDANDVAVESEDSLLVVDGSRVVRVDALTGRRSVVGTSMSAHGARPK